MTGLGEFGGTLIGSKLFSLLDGRVFERSSVQNSVVGFNIQSLH
jgi:hypothetical protein